MERLEAMELASREAAIRERLEQEMYSACASSASSFSHHPQPTTLPSTPSTVLPPSPARARGSSQPGQLSGRRSATPRSRNSLHMQPGQKPRAPLVATAVAGSGSSFHSGVGSGSLGSPRPQRAASFGADSFRQAADAAMAAARETFQTAESFRQAALSPRPQRSDSFLSPRGRRSSTFGRVESFGGAGSPVPRTPSYVPVDVVRFTVDQGRSPSPSTSRASSFSLGHGVVLSRSNSNSAIAATAVAGPPRSMQRHHGGPPGSVQLQPATSYAPAAVQRSVAMEDEHAQLQARLNIAAEMIDSLVMDSSVLDEAKRLTEAIAHKQRRQQELNRQSPSRRPQEVVSARPLQSPARPRSRNQSLFWKPPPEAAQLCARCPSMEIPAAQSSSRLSNTSQISLPCGGSLRQPPPSSQRGSLRISPRVR